KTLVELYAEHAHLKFHVNKRKLSLIRKFDVEELTPIAVRPRLTEIIAGHLIHPIMEGQYTSGDRLPTELELAQRFHTGRGTVREALKALTVVGLIRVERGKGTFV